MGKRGIVLAVLAAAVFAGSLLLAGRIGGTGGPPSSGREPRRIVSLAPSVTETLFALGLGNRVVGVTKFCDYPPAALSLPRVGGYIDPDYEAVTRLKPDLVIGLTASEHGPVGTNLAQLGLRFMAVDQGRVDGLLDSIPAIGRACGAESAAERMVAGLRARMNAVERRTAELPRPRVLVSLGRTMGTESVKEVYVAGCDGYFDRLIALAGGTNAYSRSVPLFPKVTAEGLAELAPDVIIDLVPDLEEKKLSVEAVLAEWRAIEALDAVRGGRVYVLSGDYVEVPGPRFVRLLDDMARAIHPDVPWDEDPAR